MVAVLGCGTSSGNNSGPSTASETATGVVFQNSQFPSDDRISLVSGDKFLRIGDPVDDFRAAFPKPDVPHLITSTDLPRPLVGSVLKAEGWETQSAGFGMLVDDSVVLLAMQTAKGLSDEQTQQKVLDIQKRTGQLVSVSVDGPNLRYTFWQFGNVEMMFLTQKDGQTYRTVTAIGEYHLMDALRMSPRAAREDVQALTKK